MFEFCSVVPLLTALAFSHRDSEGQVPTYAQLAAKDFQRGSSGRNPHDLVRSGERTIDDWIRTLDARRDQHERVLSNEGRLAKASRVTSRAKLSVLASLETCPAATRELRKRLSLPPASLEGTLRALKGSRLIEDCEGEWRIARRGVCELAYLRSRHHKASATSPLVYEPINAPEAAA